ncbi:hypothetical protein RRG08_047177 [Elysia crispata]|uniref:Uncharacterized protein n=1 Tax=Elysia crispata TaxID=231223 RepID=A0AAE0YPP7_9GAST|nr:hypothetical protein RRG08_047177 [Elysia crispata]
MHDFDKTPDIIRYLALLFNTNRDHGLTRTPPSGSQSRRSTQQSPSLSSVRDPNLKPETSNLREIDVPCTILVTDLSLQCDVTIMIDFSLQCDVTIMIDFSFQCDVTIMIDFSFQCDVTIMIDFSFQCVIPVKIDCSLQCDVTIMIDFSLR